MDLKVPPEHVKNWLSENDVNRTTGAFIGCGEWRGLHWVRSEGVRRLRGAYYGNDLYLSLTIKARRMTEMRSETTRGELQRLG